MRIWAILIKEAPNCYGLVPLLLSQLTQQSLVFLIFIMKRREVLFFDLVQIYHEKIWL